MSNIFDANLEARTAAYYAELEAREAAAEQVVEDAYMVFYTYSDGYVLNEVLSGDVVREDYADLEERLDEGLKKMEVYSVIYAFGRYEDHELLYIEEF